MSWNAGKIGVRPVVINVPTRRRRSRHCAPRRRTMKSNQDRRYVYVGAAVLAIAVVLAACQAALQGKTFNPGPTDHDSTIVAIPNGLEDQLSAPLVTSENVDDPKLWGNQVGK